MRKVLGYIVVAGCILIYALSSHSRLTYRLTTYKIQTYAWFPSGKYKYGDLYDMSFLSYFRKTFRKDTSNRVECIHDKKIDLYAVGDSYMLLSFTSGRFYCGVDKLTYFKTSTRQKLESRLDPSRINVLLLEFSERNLRLILDDSLYVENVTKASPAKNVKKLFSGSASNVNLLDYIFCKDINENLESNIWDYSFLTPLKELKSDINYRCFNTVDRNVKLSGNGKQLYYSITIDTANNTSSFNHISDAAITRLVGRLNTIYDNGKKMGFEKIYLSIIPNPVSVIEPNYGGLSYNHLAERIQYSPQLKMPYIDLMPDFKRLKNAAYLASDTHWNLKGANTWLGKVNRELVEIAEASEFNGDR